MPHLPGPIRAAAPTFHVASTNRKGQSTLACLFGVILMTMRLLGSDTPVKIRDGKEEGDRYALEIVRASHFPETLSDLIIPGVLLDFDLPDLARLAGPNRVVLINPVSAAGTPLSAEAVEKEFDTNAQVFVGSSAALVDWLE